METKLDMPHGFQIFGRHYKETKNLSLKDVVLFIDRDLHLVLKRMPGEMPEISITLLSREGIADIQLQMVVSNKNILELVRQKTEEVLWDYNEQLFTAKNGRLVPQEPRFQFHVEIH